MCSSSLSISGSWASFLLLDINLQNLIRKRCYGAHSEFQVPPKGTPGIIHTMCADNSLSLVQRIPNLFVLLSLCQKKGNKSTIFNWTSRKLPWLYQRPQPTPITPVREWEQNTKSDRYRLCSLAKANFQKLWVTTPYEAMYLNEYRGVTKIWQEQKVSFSTHHKQRKL